MRMETQAERIISKFGGITALSKALGHKFPSTVQGWKERGFIPADRQEEVIAAGRAQAPAIELTGPDFLPSLDESSAERKAS